MEITDLMEGSKRFLFCTVHGLKDFFTGMLSVINIIRAQEPRCDDDQRTSRLSESSSVKNKFLQCVVFGFCFWVSNLIFNTIVLDFIIAFLVKWFGENANVWLLTRILCLIFYFLWIFPLFFLSKLLCFLWYQDIADSIFVSSNIKKNTDLSISMTLADQFKSFVLQTIYCVQGYIVFLLPLPTTIQYIWYICHLALLSSLYAFEYKWVHMGMRLHRRLLTIDKKWPYYLGFGLPLALMTTVFTSFIDSMIVFATLFPVYVVSSANTPDNQSPAFFPIHTFKFSDFASDVVISFIWKVLPAGFTFFIR